MLMNSFYVNLGEEWSQECWEEPREKCSSIPRQVCNDFFTNPKILVLKAFVCDRNPKSISFMLL